MSRETIHRLTWDTGEGEQFPVFVRELRGDGPGPVLLLVGGEHGIELTGPAGIDLVCRELLDARFTGTVLAMPSIAPCNIRYRNHTRNQPRGQRYTYEMPYNTWAKWPGRADGDPAERLCHLVWTQIVPRADVTINFHTWCRNSAGCLFTSAGVPGMQAIAENFGMSFHVLDDLHDERCLHGLLLHEGRRAALVELRGQWRIEPDELERVRNGIYNTMVTLGMLTRPLVLPRPSFRFRDEATVVAPRDGLFIPLKAADQIARQGECVGYLLDLDTGERLDIHSPIDGAVWLVARTGTGPDVRLEGLHAYAEKGDLLLLVKETVS